MVVRHRNPPRHVAQLIYSRSSRADRLSLQSLLRYVITIFYRFVSILNVYNERHVSSVVVLCFLAQKPQQKPVQTLNAANSTTSFVARSCRFRGEITENFLSSRNRPQRPCLIDARAGAHARDFGRRSPDRDVGIQPHCLPPCTRTNTSFRSQCTRRIIGTLIIITTVVPRDGRTKNDILDRRRFVRDPKVSPTFGGHSP